MSFAKILNKVSNRHHTSQLFDDFLQMAVCAFSLGRSEAIYLDIAKKYNEEEIKSFGDALGALILEHEVQNKLGWKDFLGNYFEEFGQYNSKMGQFFTPESLCNLMASITNDDVKKEYRQTVNDPSCGSSRNLIAHATKDPLNRFNYFYIGQDLDRRCCLMSVLNFVMFGMSGVVIYMDALSLKIYGGWRIWMPETGLGVDPLTENQCKQFLFTEKKEVEVVQIVQEVKVVSKQLTLF
jgi:type I restriction-modification system DNA methylase subunit